MAFSIFDLADGGRFREVVTEGTSAEQPRLVIGDDGAVGFSYVDASRQVVHVKYRPGDRR